MQILPSGMVVLSSWTWNQICSYDLIRRYGEVYGFTSKVSGN